MKIKIIKEAFEKSQAVQECKDRLRILTKGRGNVEEKFNELWINFSKLMKCAKDEAEETKKDITEKEEKEKNKNLQDDKKLETYQQFVSRMGREKNIKDFKVISGLWKEEKEKRSKK